VEEEPLPLLLFRDGEQKHQVGPLGRRRNERTRLARFPGPLGGAGIGKLMDHEVGIGSR
jgi:hypothetical protein